MTKTACPCYLAKHINLRWLTCCPKDHFVNFHPMWHLLMENGSLLLSTNAYDPWGRSIVDQTTSGCRGVGFKYGAPPTAAELWFVMPQNGKYFRFCVRSLRSRFNLRLILNRNRTKNTLKMTYNPIVNTFDDFIPPPPRLTKSTPPRSSP